MEYHVADIIKEVRVTLDQNMTSDALTQLGDVDTLALDEIIRGKVVEGVRTAVMNAPLSLLGPGIPFGHSIAWDEEEGQGSGYVRLPNDFLRLIVFQMTDWARPVFEAISPTSAKYNLQHSKFPGIRGNPDKPVVAIVNTAIGMTLEFYSCTGGEGTAIKQASYIPHPRIIAEKIHIPYQLKDAAVYYTAYLTAVTTQQNELAEKLMSVCQTLLNNNPV